MWCPVIFPSSFKGILALSAPRSNKTKGGKHGKQRIGNESLKFFSGMADLVCGFHQVAVSLSVLTLKWREYVTPMV